MRLSQIQFARLQPLNVGERRNCLAIDIAGGKNSLLRTSRGNYRIITMINCFTSYAVAVYLPNLTFNSIIPAVVVYLICIDSTFKRIFTNQGKAFDSNCFHKFCILFCINKFRTTACRPQSNGIC